ncbi:hypothetical protein V8F20_006938 [Naviculisporaceae sp. PSN 640]
MTPRNPRSQRPRRLGQPKTSPTVFPLLSLPIELRLEIYELVLIRSCRFPIPYPRRRTNRGENDRNRRFRTQIGLNLLLSCRQVYQEASKILYSRNHFIAVTDICLESFLTSIGQNIQFLRRLQLDLHLEGREETCLLRARHWMSLFQLLAREAKGLIELEVGFSEVAPRLAPNYETGKDEKLALEIGDALSKMRNLKTLVIFGFYGMYWPAYFGTKTTALVKTFKGNRILLGTPPERWIQKYDAELERFQADTEHMLRGHV